MEAVVGPVRRSLGEEVGLVSWTGQRLHRFSKSHHRSRFATLHAAVLVFTQSRDGPER